MLPRVNTAVSRSTLLKVGLAFCFIAVLAVIVVSTIGLSEDKVLIEFYEKLITSESQKALEYELPTDANQYHADDSTIIDFGSFDFIVIGAGCTGSVIANRLSEVENWKVLLLEAGTFPNNLTEIPGLYILNSFSSYNWGFKSIPQTTACLGTVGQKCAVPRGKGVGGTTLINGLIYSRGNPTDYTRWSNLVNDSSWSYENVLHYFKKSEDLHPTDPDAPIDYAYHQTGGYWHVEHHHPDIPLKQVFRSANEELGYNLTDYNSAEHIGDSIVQYNTIMGRRHDQGTAFILPIIDRENLWVNTESYVTKVEIDNTTKVATGVIFTYQGNTYRATASKEVILSAGVISSPQILMLSGVGPQQHLEHMGIAVVQNLSVGTTFRDHTGLFGLQFSSNMTASEWTLEEEIEAYLNGTGPLTSDTQSHIIGFYKSSIEPTLNSPDLQLIMDLTGKNSKISQQFLNWNDETWNTIWVNRTTSFYVEVVLLHAKSIGTVRLNSKNPFDYPLIDYNLLTDPQNNDIDALYESINLCLDLVNTTAFKKINAKFEGRPLPACSNFQYLSKDYWYCYIRQLSVPVFHAVGTCPMGTDPLEGAVVDSSLRVFGIKNLRVADSSVFPFTLTSHTSADCAMIGEKLADAVKKDY